MKHKSIDPRHQFGDPLAPPWGASLDAVRLYDAKAEYDDELPRIHSVLAANADDDVTEIAKDFMAECDARGIKRVGIQSAREIAAKVGMLLNEIAEVEERNAKGRLGSSPNTYRVRRDNGG